MIRMIDFAPVLFTAVWNRKETYKCWCVPLPVIVNHNDSVKINKLFFTNYSTTATEYQPHNIETSEMFPPTKFQIEACHKKRNYFCRHQQRLLEVSSNFQVMRHINNKHSIYDEEMRKNKVLKFNIWRSILYW